MSFGDIEQRVTGERVDAARLQEEAARQAQLQREQEQQAAEEAARKFSRFARAEMNRLQVRDILQKVKDQLWSTGWFSDWKCDVEEVAEATGKEKPFAGYRLISRGYQNTAHYTYDYDCPAGSGPGRFYGIFKERRDCIIEVSFVYSRPGILIVRDETSVGTYEAANINKQNLEQTIKQILEERERKGLNPRQLKKAFEQRVVH